MATIKAPKKLIEVALPLDAINFAAAREKSIRHGHPSTLHIWWARKEAISVDRRGFGENPLVIVPMGVSGILLHFTRNY